jgi:hypothetical protein
VADRALGELAGRDHGVEIDARLDAHLLAEEDDVLGGDVAGGALVGGSRTAPTRRLIWSGLAQPMSASPMPPSREPHAFAVCSTFWSTVTTRLGSTSPS